MKKSEAVKMLIIWFRNDLIARDFSNISEMESEIMKALKIKNPKA